MAEATGGNERRREVGDVDVQDPQPDGARKLKPDASSLWWGLELKRSSYIAESDEKAMDSQLI